MQQKIQQAQDNYGRLLELQQKLQESLKYWQEAANLTQELREFYHNPTWSKLHDNAEQYIIDTKNNYSVLSEDAVWNALAEQLWMTEELAEIIKPILD
ncbi:Uncharacterised protein [Actinobacillus ureae]|uniref:DUF4298 domain-containing protein n=1 Tax=Actinobacillus ureae TaxID=723 RepID=UPI000E18D78B|nr:DUF4298 domain-containing protein [Actinobacillus ureae]SUT85407.1 Uncharacterised protein [Actinobacillus ureae]SUU42533.1 Uncharacterised protein [Actinobacillus ureae]